jgi:hypothetical protein
MMEVAVPLIWPAWPLVAGLHDGFEHLSAVDDVYRNARGEYKGNLTVLRR